MNIQRTPGEPNITGGKKCDLCGDCPVKCRYVDYDKDKAVAEIKLLMEDKDADILSKCITCIACNDYCPTGADHSNLIFKMQEKIGTSPIVVANASILGSRANTAILDGAAKRLEGQGGAWPVWVRTSSTYTTRASPWCMSWPRSVVLLFPSTTRTSSSTCATM